MQPGGVYKFALPRTDLRVTVDGVAIKPALAFGSWIAFMPMGSGAMFMGDLVLTDNEISPVMKRLVDGGSKSPPFTIICCEPHPQSFTCTSVATAIP